MRAAVFAAALALTACSAPLSTGQDAYAEVSRALGAPITDLTGGVYRISASPRSGTQLEENLSEFLIADVAGQGRPGFADHGVIQFHPPSQSYPTPYGNMRFYAHDERTVLLELFAEETAAVYFPARIEADGRRLVVMAYVCNQLPSAFREAHGMEYDCSVNDAAVLREAMDLLDLDALDAVVFDWVAAVPDRQ